MAQAPPLGNLAPAHAATCDYMSFFQDQQNDPFLGNYAAALGPYLVPVANQNVATPADVQELALNCQRQSVPTAFLLLHDDGKLHIYLQLDKFHTRMGMPPTQWDDTMFCQKGDLFHNQAQLVFWLQEYFHQLNGQVRVGSRAAIDTALAGDPAAELLGPFAAVDADTELVRVRRTCFVPPAFVPAFLASQLTPKEAWQQVGSRIINENREADCVALLDFLRVAMTRSGVGQLSSLAVQAPTAPVADAVLLSHRRRIIERDFPALNAALPQLQQNLIAQELSVLVADNRTARVEDEIRRQKDIAKPLTDLVGDHGVDYLLRICGVQAEHELPPLWSALKSAKKHNRLNVLQHSIDVAKLQCDEPEMQFIATPALLQAIVNMAFGMSQTDSITTGLQPFVLGEQMESSAREALYTYEALYSGGSAPSSTDIAALMKATITTPKHHFQARHMLRRSEILCRELFGPQHPSVVTLQSFCIRYSSLESQLHRQAMTQPREYLPTIILRHVSLHMSHYFQRIKLNPNAAFPSIADFWDDLLVDGNWERPVPPQVLSQLGMRPTGGGPPAGAAAGGLAVPGAGWAVPPAGGAAGTAPTRMSNPNFNSIFQPYLDMRTVTCKSLKDKIVEGALPPLPSSKGFSGNMCLAYHTKGTCMSNCRCVLDHVLYSTAEYQPLLTWCVSHFRAA